MITNFKERFIEEQKRTTREATWSSYSSDIKLFLEYMSNIKRINEELELIQSITNDDVEDWLTIMSDSKSPADERDPFYELTTLNRKIASLSVFFEYMKESKGKIDKNPFKNVKPYKNINSERREMLTLDEVKIFIEQTYVINKDDRAREFNSARTRFLTALMCTTGLRINEALSIKFTDIEEKSDAYMINLKAKNVKNHLDKRVPICGITKKYYHEYLAERSKIKHPSDENLVILSSRGKRFDRKASEEQIQKYVQRINVDKEIVNHSFRHTFRTTLATKGVNETLICLIGGWALQGMSAIYIHDSVDLDQKKIEVCNIL